MSAKKTGPSHKIPSSAPAPAAINKRTRPLSSLIPESINKINKNIDREAADEEEPASDQEDREDEDKNEPYMSENIMFAYVENQVQAHNEFKKFADIESRKTSSLDQNIGLLVRIQERVTKKWILKSFGKIS